MLSFLGSVFSGGVTGPLGVVFQRWFDFLKVKQEIEMKRMNFDHEANMKRIDGELMAQEWAARTQVAEVEAAGKEAVAAQEAFAESFKMEPKKYSQKVDVSPAAGLWLVFLDVVRGIIRPGLTIYLCIVTTMVYFEAKAIVAGLGATFSVDQALDIHELVVSTILYLTTTVVLWWFGSRNSQSAPRSK